MDKMITARQNGCPGGAVLPQDPPEFQRFITATRPLDIDGIDWDAIPSHGVPDDVIRVLAYMQDVEEPHRRFSENHFLAARR
ncbi:MAG: hypothetical protein U5K38_11360 [Woeseiaceae bacterium]|nr:hypothetical protein [Woeseiaceae bacterium]